MANEKNLRPFQPGQSGNPNGRPPHPPELKEMQRLTKGQLEVILNKILFSRPEDLKNFQGSVLEIWLANGAAQAIKSGDYSRLMILIDRLVGKVKDSIEITAKPIEAWTREEKVKLLEESRESLKRLEEDLANEL